MPVSHCMFSAGRCVFWCSLAGAESDFCGRNGRLILRHNRVLVQNQGTVLKKSSHRGVHPDHFPSREGENERRPISCPHSSWIKRSTLLCRKMTWVHPVVSFPLYFFYLELVFNSVIVFSFVRACLVVTSNMKSKSKPKPITFFTTAVCADMYVYRYINTYVQTSKCKC